MSANNNGELPIRVAGDTNVGRQRDANEDNFYATPAGFDPNLVARHGRIYVVADGVGGNRGGAQASDIACRRIPEYYYAGTSSDPGVNLRLAIEGAGREIATLANQSIDLKDMSCTVAVLVLRHNQALIAHLGDARVYRVNRDGQIQQQTEDHTWVQEQVRKGTLTPEEARRHPNRNVITRSLGHMTPQPDVSRPFILQDGERLLLCSDGLTGEVTDAAIARTLQQNPEPESAVRNLIAQANQNGGRDNISVVVVNAGKPVGVAAAAAPLRRLMPIAAIGIMALFLALLFFGGEGGGLANGSSDVSPQPAEETETAQVIAEDTRGSETSPESSPATATLDPGTPPTATETPTPEVSVTPEPVTQEGIASPPDVVETIVTAVSTLLPWPTLKSEYRKPILLTLLCPDGGTFRTNDMLTFEWEWAGPLAPGHTMELRINRGPNEAIPESAHDSGDHWRFSLSAGFHQGEGHDYIWRVVLLDEDRDVLSQSERGCFRIEGDKEPTDEPDPPGNGGNPSPTYIPTPPTPDLLPSPSSTPER